MKNQPNRNYKSDDVVMTPDALAKALVDHFRPSGRILEPCKGTGAFLRYLPPETLWTEISEGRDFFDFSEHVDWIVTNPPWSQIRAFLRHSYEVADNIVMLFTVNHLWLKARLRDMREAGFGLREIVLMDTPKEFPQSGFQLGAVYIQRGYSGSVGLSKLDY